jgi:hypothetical protein
MMFIVLEEAIKKLTAAGHKVGAPAVDQTGKLLISINGTLLPLAEVFRIADEPPS